MGRPILLSPPTQFPNQNTNKSPPLCYPCSPKITQVFIVINFKEKANFIWSVADLLRGDYKQSEYGKVVLPLTVLRRLDTLLAPTKAKVLELTQKHDGMPENALEAILNNASGYKFHNKSKLDFKGLVADPDGLVNNFSNYLNGFSVAAREIIEYFDFGIQIKRLADADLLYKVMKEFQKDELNFFSSLTSLEMGYIFEELIRKFSEISNETAGEHFTPREVIELMVNLLFIPDGEKFTKSGIIQTLYDPTCGTGGMLSEAESYVRKLNQKAKLEVFGQEINHESYAICKSDMLIKGQDPANIKVGDTLRNDQLSGEKFDYMLANPPFGVEWKKALNEVKLEADKMGYNGRFGAGLPRINDGSLLFLQHMIAKMKQPNDAQNGTRLAIVLNGSPLFTGGAGSGESDIRKWIIENDMLEAIVAMPDQLFYNTGISTYIWILSNHKSALRKGKIQLINATSLFVKMARSLGNKRNEISKKQIETITKSYGDFTENEFCKIYPNHFFGYSRITIERPVKDTQEQKELFKQTKKKADSALRDYENVPLSEDIEEYFTREVLPHVPDAWIDHSKTKVGYEVNFTKYFYQYKPLRNLADIRVDILKLEEETDGMIKEVLQ